VVDLPEQRSAEDVGHAAFRIDDHSAERGEIDDEPVVDAA